MWYYKGEVGDCMVELSEEILEEVILKRKQESHKGTYGRVVLIGGNEQYGGAIILGASAAVHSGAGLVSVVSDKKNHSSLHARLPEAMTLGFDDCIDEVIVDADVIGVGSGLGLSDESLVILKKVLTKVEEEQWLIIDGSAITLFAKNELTLKYPHKTIFTPHEMEWQRLSGIEIAKQSVEVSQNVVNKLGCTAIVKSHQTKIFIPNREPYFLTIGTPAQATGGMGDVLVGILSAFLAQFKQDSIKSICAGVYLHSLIASKLALDSYVVLPSKLIDSIPTYMKKYSI